MYTQCTHVFIESEKVGEGDFTKTETCHRLYRGQHEWYSQGE